MTQFRTQLLTPKELPRSKGITCIESALASCKSGFSLLTLLLGLIACQPEENLQRMQVSYPDSATVDHTDDYFGVKVPDPYRWLEDDLSKDTADWVSRQNEVTSNYLKQISYRQELKQRLESLWRYRRISAPFVEGEFEYFYENNGLQDQSVVQRRSTDGITENFLDPNKFSDNGTAALSGLAFSKSADLAAYSISEAGSDWNKIFIVDVETRQQLETPITDVKFSAITWLNDQGFYYSSYKQPEGSRLSAQVDDHRLYFHQIGTHQSADVLIFGGSDSGKRRYVSADLTEDHRFLSIQSSMTTKGNDLRIVDKNQHPSTAVTLQDDFDSDTYLLGNDGETLFLFTDRGAANGKLVSTTLNAPEPGAWHTVIAETSEPLRVSMAGGYLFAHYLKDAQSVIHQYDYSGAFIREVVLPGPGSASLPIGKQTQTTLYYRYNNYKTPPSIYSFNADNGESSLYFSSSINFDPSKYVSEQIFYVSKDGTRIPMTITHLKSLTRNGLNPTILYGYGGFDISITPSFNPANALWLSLGGIYAVANLRGGGEYGNAWHNQGIQMQKQNVFDDFISAAEILIARGYTSKEFLAISGRSNGGLLVGAVMTQRPDLMQVALPAVGVLDMLRYHTFTAGAGWAYDYGHAEQSRDMFQYLKSYSPLHNITSGAEYPATLITTGDHDDRVVPAHSFKFAATLQQAQASPAPTLIRIETQAGHGAGTPVSKTLEKYADQFAFTLFNMGVKQLPPVKTEQAGK